MANKIEFEKKGEVLVAEVAGVEIIDFNTAKSAVRKLKQRRDSQIPKSKIAEFFRVLQGLEEGGSQ